MNNFDLRKYLAEGRLKINEGDMDHLMQDLERGLKQHDWFYYMSDDPRTYDKGTNEQGELKRLLKMLNNSPEAIALYNKYAPVQDGIDLRIKEEKRPDYPDVDKDGDTEESMEKALKDRETSTVTNEGYYGSSDIDNIASTLGYDDIDSFFNDNPGAVDAIMQWAEKVPDFERMLQDAGMMQENIEESLRAWNVIDAEGNIVHEELPYDEALAKAKEVEGHKIDATDRLAEEDYDPDQEQLDDEGRPLEEAVNPEVHRLVNAFVRKIADRYDYPLQDAVYAILAVLRSQNYLGLNEDLDLGHEENIGLADLEERGYEAGEKAAYTYGTLLGKLKNRPDKLAYNKGFMQGVKDELGSSLSEDLNEDLDLGHEDDEPGMLKGDLYKIGKYAMELYQMVDEFDGEGEVDFPHWWQSKVTTAKNMISGAKHYLEFELKEPAIDAMVTEDSIEDEAKVYFMQKVKRGEIDELPEDPKAAFLAQMTKDQMDHDRETLDREGGLGEASFYTKDVKDVVISKLMDQLKK